jgi:hypothetical protein
MVMTPQNLGKPGFDRPRNVNAPRVVAAPMRRYGDCMNRKFAIYAPPKKAKLPHLVAVIKNGKLKDTFGARSRDEAEDLLRSIKARTEARGD